MTLSYRAADFRHQVTIQQNSGSKDDTGAVADNWTTFATTRAAINPWKAKERTTDDKQAMHALFNVRIRYISGVLPSMRVVFGSRTFEILSIQDPEERNRVLNLTCREDV